MSQDTTVKLSKKIESFIVSNTQMQLDKQMAGFDIWGTIAHVLMLYKTNIINKEQAAKILKALLEIQVEYDKGNFEIDPAKGAQLSLEDMIIQKAGSEAGLAAHTGRSRNDQIMVTENLSVKEELLSVIAKSNEVVEALIAKSKDHIHTVMPGYTHMQPAKPTTFGQWCLAYADTIMMAVQSLKFYFDKFNLNPLGAAESYGTSWPIDREYTTKLLAFDEVWEIPQAVISSRGQFQLEILSGFSALTMALNKMACDLMIFTSFEHGTISLGEDVAQRLHPITGSSIMAQKKNPDAIELIRSMGPQLTGIFTAASNVLSGLPMGYNRDSREIKEYIDLGFQKVNACLDAVLTTIKTMEPMKQRMLDLVNQNYSMTTDVADFIAQKTGTPYRLVYKIVGKVVDKAIETGKFLKDITAKEIIETGKEFDAILNIMDKDIQMILDPVVAVDKRNHIGGANENVMNKLILSKHAQLQNLQEWVSGKIKFIADTKATTYAKAKEIAGM